MVTTILGFLNGQAHTAVFLNKAVFGLLKHYVNVALKKNFVLLVFGFDFFQFLCVLRLRHLSKEATVDLQFLQLEVTCNLVLRVDVTNRLLQCSRLDLDVVRTGLRNNVGKAFWHTRHRFTQCHRHRRLVGRRKLKARIGQQQQRIGPRIGLSVTKYLSEGGLKRAKLFLDPFSARLGWNLRAKCLINKARNVRLFFRGRRIDRRNQGRCTWSCLRPHHLKLFWSGLRTSVTVNKIGLERFPLPAGRNKAFTCWTIQRRTLARNLINHRICCWRKCPRLIHRSQGSGRCTCSGHRSLWVLTSEIQRSTQ